MWTNIHAWVWINLPLLLCIKCMHIFASSLVRARQIFLLRISFCACMYVPYLVAVATINFSLAGVRQLIEGSSFLGTSYYFEAIPPAAIHKNSNVKDYFFRTSLQITEIWSKNKQPCCLRTKPRTSSAMLLPWTNDRPPLAIVATPT